MDELEQSHPTNWVRDFILVAISRFGIFFSFRQVNPVFPVYLASLGASGALIGFIMSSFTIMATVSRPFVGMLIDRSGRKRFLIGGIVLLSVSTLGYSLAPGLVLLVLFRMLHGVGWSGCTTTVSTLAADIAPAKRRGAMIAYAGLASNIGGALGPIAGFAAYYRYGFHGMFLAVLGILFLSFLFALPIKEPERAMERGGAARSWWELLFVRESFLPGAIMGFLAFGHAATSTYIPLFVLQEQLGNPAYYFAVEAGFVILCRPIAGPLSDRLSRHAVIIPGLMLQIAGLLLLAYTSSMTTLLTAAAVIGLGFGSAHPGLMTLAIDWVPAERRGLSMAQFQTFHDLGIGIGAITLGVLLDLVDKSFFTLYLVSAVVVVIGSAIFIIFGKAPAAVSKS